MVKHNNRIVKNHFKKDWQRHIKTWFDQPAKIKRRRDKRAARAIEIFPRPSSGALRPVVHGCTLKYQNKLRLGRGFTLAELKGAGITPQFAPTIGIAVDTRRKDRSQDMLDANIQRLKLYKSKLILFPLKKGKPKKGDSGPEELASVVQQKTQLPIVVDDPRDKPRAITEEEKTKSAYATLKKARREQTKISHAARKAKAAAAAPAPSSKKVVDEDDEEGGKGKKKGKK